MAARLGLKLGSRVPAAGTAIALAALPVLLAALVLAWPGSPVALLGDGAADILWAKWQASHGLVLAGHWTNSLQVANPGPAYVWVLAFGGLLLGGMHGFDTGAAAALAGACAAVAVSTAWALGRDRRSLAVTWLAALLLAAVAAAPVVDPDGGWPRLGVPVWAGTLVPWLVAATIVGAWTLAGSWRWRSAYTLLLAGLTLQVYLPAAPLAGVVLAAAGVTWWRARSDRAAFTVGALALALGAGPVLVRLAAEGPGALLPRAVLADHRGTGIDGEAGLATVSFHAGGLPAWLVLAVMTGLVAACALRWSHLTGSGRWRSGVVVVVTLAAAAQQLLAYPSAAGRYQSSWVTLTAVLALAGALGSAWPMSWPSAARRVRRPLTAVVAVGAGLCIVFGVAGGHMLTEPSSMLVSDTRAPERVAGQLERLELPAGQPVALHVPYTLFDAGPAVLNVLESLGVDACVIGRDDLSFAACTPASPAPSEPASGAASGAASEVVTLTLTRADAGDSHALAVPQVLGGTPLMLQLAGDLSALQETRGPAGTHPYLWNAP
jgi:hypothetical protein